MKKSVCIILALLMLLAATGCGKNNKRKPIELTLSSEDSEEIMRAAGIHLPPAEEAAGAGTVVKWFSWINLFENFSEDEIVQTGYYTFREKYGGKINWIETTYDDRNTDLATLVLTSQSPDMTNAGTAMHATFPMNVIKDMYQPVDKWIDYENDPLWKEMKDAGEYYVLGGKHFAIVYDLTFKDVIPYNRRVMTEYGYDDPWQLYLNDEWTWDVFYDMCIDFNDPDSDRFAVDGWYVTCSIVEESTGHYIIERDENGHYYANLDDPVIERAHDLIYNLAKNDCIYRVGNDYWGINSYGGSASNYGYRVKDGLTLFWPCDDEGFVRPVEELKRTFGDVTDGEFMICPLPRDPNGDGVYYLNAMPDAFNLIKGAPNPDGAVLLAMCTRFKIMDPTVVRIDRKQLREKYYWSDEMLEAWDECMKLVRENVRVYYTGNLTDNVEQLYNQFDWGVMRTGGANTYTQIREQNRDTLQYYLDELNDQIDSYVYEADLET